MAELYQIEFKGSRREFFYNSYYHSLKVGEHVIVQGEQGEEMGILRQKIEIEVGLDPRKKPRSILRRAGDDDHSRFLKLKEDEVRLQNEVVGIIAKHNLAMKVVDVECLFDGSKITFYFTADFGFPNVEGILGK